MNLDNLRLTLTETFEANFVAYYRAHVAHVNIVGRNFASDHKLLQKIYEDLQGNIDTLAELLRTVGSKMPNSLHSVMMGSPIMDDSTEGTADELLEMVHEDQEALIDQYKLLNEAAEEVQYVDIANYAQGRVGDHAKFRWMLEATLGIESENEKDEQDDEDERRIY